MRYDLYNPKRIKETKEFFFAMRLLKKSKLESIDEDQSEESEWLATLTLQYVYYNCNVPPRLWTLLDICPAIERKDNGSLS